MKKSISLLFLLVIFLFGCTEREEVGRYTTICRSDATIITDTIAGKIWILGAVSGATYFLEFDVHHPTSCIRHKIYITEK